MVVRRHVGRGQATPRCTPRPWRSPAITTSRSGWPPSIEPRPDQGAAGAPGRDRPQPRAVLAAASPRLASWTLPSQPGAADPPRADPPHSRRRHRGVGRTRPGRACCCPLARPTAKPATGGSARCGRSGHGLGRRLVHHPAGGDRLHEQEPACLGGRTAGHVPQPRADDLRPVAIAPKRPHPPHRARQPVCAHPRWHPRRRLLHQSSTTGSWSRSSPPTSLKRHPNSGPLSKPSPATSTPTSTAPASRKPPET